MTAAHPIPLVPPEVVAGRIQRRILRPLVVCPHIGVIGHTRSGKDYLVRHVVLGMTKPLARAAVLDVKLGHDPAGCPAPRCAGLGDQTWCGWGNDVGAGCERGELPERLGAARWRVLIPGSDGARPLAERTLGQLAAVRECVVILSDAGRITEPPNRGGLALGGLVSRLMSEGASGGLTVIACSTSAAWLESSIKDQTPTKLIGQVSGKKARDDVAHLAGLPAWARPALDSLPDKHFVYADHLDGEPALAIVTAPAPGQLAGRAA
jgi:hypothetical protein